jgi:hypothetical protein
VAPRGSGGRSVSPADSQAYLAKASSWLEAAGDSLGAGRWDVAAGSAVTAGINACDAISGSLLGRRAGGDHTEALTLLEGAGSEGRAASRQLAQLLRYKKPAQYDPAPMSERDARKAVELARRLTERAEATIGRHPGSQSGAQD